ncbi:hypothetical protein [Methylobacterium thuringiense]|uniref:Periplasmic protein n=1 Tax=Methylobacterium thuringiense TaxID=1003091 RepID=A0ABQ4TNW9_9HYPH|nr:hypothetical protein [Methylobacterium thuringiense]GJE56014.1 hypothetical protein EKPJFOCH_2511 [Methylobacterium thuringiense]
MAAAWRVVRGIGLAGLALACLGAGTVVQAHLRSGLEPAETVLFGIYARLSLELESRLGTDLPGPETRIVLGPGGRDVRLSGELTEGAGARLERLLAENPRVERIHLTSEGGLVDEGEAIGAAIARHRLATYVPDFCVSACTLAFVRGRERHIMAATRLGFHAPYEAGLFGQVFRADGAPERAAYIAAGVSAEFADAALRVASQDIWFPDPDRLLAAGVATGIVDASRFPDSTLDDGDDAAHARATVLRNLDLLHGFEARAPRVVDGIAAWYLDSYRSGLSEADAFEGLKRLAARSLSRAMRGADDRSLVAMGRHLLKAMEASRADPAACAAIGADGNLVLARQVLKGEGSRLDETGDLAARALVVRALSHADRPVPEPDARTLADDALRPLSAPPHAACAGLRTAYAEALALPRRDAAATLRGLINPSAAPRPSLEASAQP